MDEYIKVSIEILKEIRPDIDFENNEKLIDGGFLASLEIMEIVSEISDAFDVELSPADIIPQNFNSAKAMWDMIQRLQ